MGKGMGGGGVGESYKVNNEVENVEFVSITDVVEVERDVNINTFSTNLT